LIPPDSIFQLNLAPVESAAGQTNSPLARRKPSDSYAERYWLDSDSAFAGEVYRENGLAQLYKMAQRSRGLLL
jgi:hypothetical protein